MGQKPQAWGDFRAGMVACVPTLLGYWAIGFACGAIGNVSGFSLAEIASMSIFIYAGSAQFLIYQLKVAGAGVLAIAIGVAFINMRYLLINSYMAQFFSQNTLFEKWVGGLLMTDETFGVAARYAKKNDGKMPFSWLLGLNLLAWGNWIFATLTGCLFADFLPDWLRESFSFSLVGMFLGLLVLTFYESRTKIIDMAVILAAIATMIFSRDILATNPASMIATLLAAIFGTLLLRIVRNRIRQGR